MARRPAPVQRDLLRAQKNSLLAVCSPATYYYASTVNSKFRGVRFVMQCIGHADFTGGCWLFGTPLVRSIDTAPCFGNATIFVLSLRGFGDDSKKAAT